MGHMHILGTGHASVRQGVAAAVVAASCERSCCWPIDHERAYRSRGGISIARGHIDRAGAY
eukprot:151275-Chlamydomonas_euryale.AAC.1